MDFEPTEDQQTIRKAVAELAGRFDDRYWSEHDRDHAFPAEFYDALATGGWLTGGAALFGSRRKLSKMAVPGAATACHVPALSSTRSPVIGSCRVTVRRVVHVMRSLLVSKRIESVAGLWRMRQ